MCIQFLHIYVIDEKLGDIGTSKTLGSYMDVPKIVA